MAVKPQCEPFFSLLSPFVDGELSAAERVRVERHTAECKDCAGRVADIRAEAGLVRVGMELLADQADFSDFAAKVMARVTPEKAPLFERLSLSLSELFTYQRGFMIGALGAAAAVAIAAVTFLARPTTPEGYANQRMALHSVTTDEDAHVAPVMMETDEGDSIIWVVDHAHVNGAPDASQKEVDSSAPSGQKKVEPPQGGEL